MGWSYVWVRRPGGLKTVWASAVTNMWLKTGIQTVGRTPYNVGIARVVVADSRMVAPNC
jgi:hypothetical protein